MLTGNSVILESSNCRMVRFVLDFAIQLAEDIAFHDFYSFNLYSSSLQRRYTSFESHRGWALLLHILGTTRTGRLFTISHLLPLEASSQPFKDRETPTLAYSLPSRVNAYLHHLDQGYGGRTGRMHLILLSTIVPTPLHRMLKGFWVNWNESSA